MGRLAGDRLQPRGGGDAEGHPEAGAGPQHQQGCRAHGFTGPHLGQLGGLQVGQAIDQHGEVVHQLHAGQPAGLSQGGLIQEPGKIGELRPPPLHRARHGEAGSFRTGMSLPRTILEEVDHHRPQVVPVGRGVALLHQQLGVGSAG